MAALHPPLGGEEHFLKSWLVNLLSYWFWSLQYVWYIMVGLRSCNLQKLNSPGFWSMFTVAVFSQISQLPALVRKFWPLEWQVGLMSNYPMPSPNDVQTDLSHRLTDGAFASVGAIGTALQFRIRQKHKARNILGEIQDGDDGDKENRNWCLETKKLLNCLELSTDMSWSMQTRSLIRLPLPHSQLDL